MCSGTARRRRVEESAATLRGRGFLFESQTVHDLRVYAQPHRGEVRFYRDNKGLEIDAIVEAADGRWFAAEIKLGHNRVDENASDPAVIGLTGGANRAVGQESLPPSRTAVQ